MVFSSVITHSKDQRKLQGLWERRQKRERNLLEVSFIGCHPQPWPRKNPKCLFSQTNQINLGIFICCNITRCLRRKITGLLSSFCLLKLWPKTEIWKTNGGLPSVPTKCSKYLYFCKITESTKRKMSYTLFFKPYLEAAWTVTIPRLADVNHLEPKVQFLNIWIYISPSVQQQ